MRHNSILYNIDLAKAENKVVAYISPDPNMITAFEQGIDLHSLTAALIFRKPIEEISDEIGSCQIGSGMQSERYWGKKANHGLNYGLGYKSFALTYEITEQEANFIVTRYFEAYPGVKHYHAWVQESLQKTRSLTDCFGKRRVFLDRWGDSLFKEAYSFIPQSTVAGLMNFNGLSYIWKNRNMFQGLELLNTVHDSIVFQISNKYNSEYHAILIKRICDSLEQPILYRGREFSIGADVSIGYNLKKLRPIKDRSQWSMSEFIEEVKRKEF
ncbi:hypothetical protein KKH13_04745 [Patescibacteria group bacterium]|uniref:Putative DNA polymerase n=1 Tax=viral metagenome TaxID=1070528 RepID=A0A6M3KR68_9ZZZZ|nr:hypothetical protein [Patescibacteria group bacterium]